MISRDVSLLTPFSFDVTLIVQISFLQDSVETHETFSCQMSDLPNVRQSYHVSGSSDYILVVMKRPSHGRAKNLKLLFPFELSCFRHVANVRYGDAVLFSKQSRGPLLTSLGRKPPDF